MLSVCTVNTSNFRCVVSDPSKVNKDIEQRVVFCSDEEDKAARLHLHHVLALWSAGA